MSTLFIISLNGDPLADLGSLHAGGQCKYILELGKYLVRTGWAIDVFTIQQPGTLRREYITEEFSVNRLPLASGGSYGYHLPLSEFTPFSFSMLRYIEEFCAPPDLLLACYWLSGVVALPVKAALKKDLVVSFCSLGYYKQQACPELSLTERIETERLVAAGADRVIATSHDEQHVLTSIYAVPARKISLIPRGIDLDVFKPRT